jgi:hypothetical protein
MTERVIDWDYVWFYFLDWIGLHTGIFVSRAQKYQHPYLCGVQVIASGYHD